MSSAWNHASSHSMVAPLRTAQSGSRSIRKGCSYSTSATSTNPASHFRRLYAESLHPPVDAPPRRTERRPDTLKYTKVGPTDPSSCEFWCSSRLNLSLHHRYSFPLARASKPWIPIDGGGEANRGADSSPSLVHEPHILENGSQQETLDGSQATGRAHPSYYLIDALQNMVRDSPNTHPANWTFSGPSHEYSRASLTWKQKKSIKWTFQSSLQVITADFIETVDPVLRRSNGADISNSSRAVLDLEYALRKMLRDGSIDYLSSRQYSITDTMAWAWVLTSDTSYEATLRLFSLETDRAAKLESPRSVPVFVPLLLLRQENDLDLKTFRLLLVYSLHTIIGRSMPSLDSSTHTVSDHRALNHNGKNLHGSPSLDYNTCQIFVVRLLFHAQRLWPEAQLPIAQALSIFLHNSGSRQSKFVTQKLNKLLALLSSPSKPRPFVSASVQQEAQFELLKAMGELSPASPVTREGYRGLAAVQLAHKKTAAERESAELKTPSWPPWKEERSGIDSTKGLEGAKSRATRVLSQMKEAGYPHRPWEKVTGILAGWDTDNSPTIQTRALAPAPRRLRGESSTWEARIRSTRTVREAWACFTAYESQGLRPCAATYAAMGEKLVFEHHLKKKHPNKTLTALPGDGPEVFPEPASARDWIYTPSEPPTTREFLEMMLSQGIRPSGKFLVTLLLHSQDFGFGLYCLSCSHLTNQQLRVLLTFGEKIPDSDIEAKKVLNEIPESLFSAFIQFLCTFSQLRRQIPWSDDETIAEAFPILFKAWDDPLPHIPTLFAFAKQNSHTYWYPRLLCHAMQLLRKRESQNPKPWTLLLRGLSSTRIREFSNVQVSTKLQIILAWHEVSEVLKWLDERNIEIGTEGFQIACFAFSRAMAAGAEDEESREQALEILASAAGANNSRSDLSPESFDDMVNTGIDTIERLFDRLVLVDPNTSSLFDSQKLSLEQQTEGHVIVPALPHIPSPAALHMFVRCLGLAEDWDGLLNFLRWMSRHAQTLKQRSNEYANGEVQMRRAIVASCMFLEASWRKRRLAPTTNEDEAMQYTSSDPDAPKLADPLLQEAYDIVTAAGVFGAWPSNEEIWRYSNWKEQ